MGHQVITWFLTWRIW